MNAEEREKIIAEVIAQEKAKAEKLISQEKAKAEKLEQGKFFSPWPVVWEKEQVPKQQCDGVFNVVCREEGYAGSVPAYSELLARSMSESEMKKIACNEKNDPNPRKELRKSRRKENDKVAQYASASPSPSSRSSRGSSQRKNQSAAASQPGRNSVESSLSGSKASSASQSMKYPDFGGGKPSTRAHMIPNINTSTCFKYYNVICQAVVGFRSNDGARLERIARELAESDYNFLRASLKHGDYFDSKPCWILVPACPLKKIRNWKPGDTYPVLAVANSAGGTEVEEAYQMMCHFPYNDENVDRAAGVLKRSKCNKQEFDDATHNLRQMTLAMAETLVGGGFGIRPDQILHENRELDEEDRLFIIEKLKSKTAANEGGEKSGEEGSGMPRSHLRPADYDKIQFQETARSLNSGIDLPRAKPGLDLDHFELLKFEVDPSELDLYPDPMLLLIKAAVNWSWWCNQKLLPACGRPANEEEEEEQLAVPSTPIPAVIKFKPVPVTPDEDDIVSV